MSTAAVSAQAASGAAPASNGLSADTLAYVEQLRAIALRALVRMYLPDERRFIWCLRKKDGRIAPEGNSRRYTAITLLGLIGEDPKVVQETLQGATVHDVCAGLLSDVGTVTNLGDVALTLWVANLIDHPDRRAAADKLALLEPLNPAHYVVELAWCVSALSLSTDERLFGLRDSSAAQLLALAADHGIFPHTVDRRGARGHVGCFADQVYPIQALSYFSVATGHADALAAADRGARAICDAMGSAGQWWWHYDARTGRVLEGYPVYSVHQDSMAPMALLDVHEAGGGDYTEPLTRGLDWLARSPELNGATLVDTEADLIWRKVCRREPRKLTRKLQAVASRLHARLRVPLTNTIFPPKAIDYECRPYHLGWILYAFSTARMERWRQAVRNRT